MNSNFQNNNFQNNNFQNNNFQNNNQNGNQYYPYANAQQKPKKNGAAIAIAIIAAILTFLIGIGVGGFIVYKVLSPYKDTQAETVAPANDPALTVTSVDWNDPEVQAVTDGREFEVYFHLSDGSVQTMNADGQYIEEMKMVDIDNDGEDEYVICSVFANTAAEYYMKYIYKFKDGEMVQLYPNSDISDMGISENEPINTEIIKVNVGDQELNGLEAVTYEKDNGVAYDRFHAIIYYNEDHWEIIETIDDYKKENASTED